MSIDAMECVAGIEWPGNVESTNNIPVDPALGSGLCRIIRQLSKCRVVVSRRCGHSCVVLYRRGIQKIPLADATVNFFDFPEEHEHFILKSP